MFDSSAVIMVLWCSTMLEDSIVAGGSYLSLFIWERHTHTRCLSCGGTTIHWHTCLLFGYFVIACWQALGNSGLSHLHHLVVVSKERKEYLCKA